MKCINFNSIITTITIVIPFVISKSVIYKSENSEPKNECFSLSQGYNCCETCNVVEKGKDGDWGIENHKWCGIKYSCYENIKCFSEPYFPCCKENKVVLVDEEGEWGIENKKWCGISSKNNTTTHSKPNAENKDKNEKSKDENNKKEKGKNEENGKNEKDHNNKNIKDEKNKHDNENEKGKGENNKHEKDKNENNNHSKEQNEKDKEQNVKNKHDTENENGKSKNNKQEKNKNENDKHSKEQNEKDKENKDIKNKDKNEKEQNEKDKNVKDNHDKEQNEKDKSEKDKNEKEQSEKDKNIKDNHDKEQNEKDKSEKDKNEKEQSEKDKNLKDNHDKEQNEKDKDEKNKHDKDKDSTSQNIVETSLPKVNMEAWKYNAEDDIYWQVGIQYCENPPALNYETLGIFIPGNFVNATKNDKDDTYTCTLNLSGVVGHYSVYNAPIVIPINTKGYMSIPSPQDYIPEAKRYTKEGIIYVFTGFRGRYEGAPLGITDIKAAVRYLRYNDDILPGSSENIFTFGFGSGGALSVIMGASGNSPLYDKYLKNIGAVEDVSDAIRGSMSWSPDASPDMANEAYEWNMGVTRQELDDFNKNLSDDLANAYAEYINKIKLKDSNGKPLILTKSDKGIYQSGSYYDYILREIETSLNKFIENTTFPYVQQPTILYLGSPENYGMDPLDDDESTHGGPITIGDPVIYKSLEHYIYSLNVDFPWITYDKETKKIHIDNLEGFVRRFKKASKKVAAFDDLEAMKEENVLFGYGKDLLIGSHFDPVMNKLLKNSKYAKSFDEDLKKKDSLNTSVEDRVNMYNPMYYLNPYYKGYKSSDVAKHWRINAGITQTETPLTTEYNLKLALENYGSRTIDFDSVWNTEHIRSERSGNSTDNFIKWINKCLKMKQ